MHGNRTYVSVHISLNSDRSPAGPFGKAGAEVSVEQGYEAARLSGLAVPGNLRRALGDLDQVVRGLKCSEWSKQRPASTGSPTLSTVLRLDP